MKFKFLIVLLFTYFIEGSDYEVKSSSGITIGVEVNEVITWDDIPYAMPPIGDLRWKAPRKINPSESNLIKPKENNFCVQEPSGLGGTEGKNYFSGNEDCLYLDIKSPKIEKTKLLPVMFWIHGGGNTTGLKDIYDFSSMVKKNDVIVVTINYRLGPFGWFSHPSIQDLQSGIDKTSNFGTLDIIQALKWVKDNIYLFGGDPNNVTIFGESAGGHNVLSLLVSSQAKDLFHKAISQSGYTTSYSKVDAYKPLNESSISKHSSWNIVNEIIKDNSLTFEQTEESKDKIRAFLKNLSAEDLFRYYANRPSYESLPLLTADGIVIPEIGLKSALSKKELINQVPTIAGSNRDEVKLWLASAKYFVDLDYSFLGSIFGVPKVKLNDKKAFNLFNSYRSRAWKIRGVDEPLRSLNKAGNDQLYAYRYDWDDHRRFIIADFRELIGAAHATEIPLLTGNNKLVGDYGFLIYPRGPSKKFTSKNMMQFWTNFAKNGVPGTSSNGIEWQRYEAASNNKSNFMVLDRRSNLGMRSDNFSFSSLVVDLYKEDSLTELEKCVVLLQMLTYVGDDLYDEYESEYPGECERKESEKFLIDNSDFIDY
ncbi:MAG: carboxylesterase family protein [Gammaproteobacteria bacterium]